MAVCLFALARGRLWPRRRGVMEPARMEPS
jgi:hypothetical protein